MPPDAATRRADPYRLARNELWASAYRAGRPSAGPDGAPSEPAPAARTAEVVPFRQLR
jgi:hypothetical protein